VGLHTRGSGADNIRNITCNPTAGIDPYELIDTLPFARELGHLIVNQREFYDLPRKFNVAFDGGGLIGSLEETNDIGLSAVKLTNEFAGLTPGVYFTLKLGGATGHKAFASDAGVLIPPSDLVSFIANCIRVYIANGDRTNRKKARLKHLLESWTKEQFVAEAEKLLGKKLPRITPEEAAKHLLTSPLPSVPHSHIGVFSQKQPELNYIGVALPAGQVTPKQMLRLAEIADQYGSGEIRLTVWQNLLIPNIPNAAVESVKKALLKMRLDCQQSNIRSGLVACTGNAWCKFAASNTKKHAVELADFLERHVQLDQPVNIHLTGCPNSCAQHYIGDIGLLATQVKVAGE
jgi:ferredoxin-nitrite reductase